ncbi:MAG TPA: alcohol dehydrogenase catalytic domain-containing protein [Acidimicrobiia bacterium]|nr:alcohol dehydrogenase catalytic domain-containing protein [Acidimicrobiia bacterium]
MKPTSTPALRLTGVGRLDRVPVPVATPAEDEVLVRVLAVGLCGSDAHWFEEGGIGDAVLGEGLILGHEMSAVIESGPRRGERVAVDPSIPCLVCPPCLAGRPNLCADLRFAGHGGTDGGLRGHLVWPRRCLVPIPDQVSAEAGALLEPLGVALHAIDLGRPENDEQVVVVGAGPIGLLVISALRARGAGPILVTDRLPHRLDAALELGASQAVAATEDDEELELLNAAVAGGAGVVIETAGNDMSLGSALTAARPGGRVVLVGIPSTDRSCFVASTARRKELTLYMCRRMLPGDLVRAAALAGEGRVDLDPLVSHRYPLSAGEEAFSALVARSGLKVVVLPDAEA